MRYLRRLCTLALLVAGAVAAPAATAVTLKNGDIIINSNDGTLQRILRVDPATAAVTPIATVNLRVRGLGMDAAGNILVAGFGPEGGGSNAKVLRIDAATGVASVATSGGLLADPQDAVQTADGALVVSDLTGGVIRVETSGTQRRLAANGALVPGNLNGPAGLTLDASGDLLVVNRNTVDRGVLRMDPQTGAYSTVASGSPPFSIPLGIAVQRNGQIIVAESNATGGGGIVRVDPAAHTAVNFSPGNNPMDVGVEPHGTLVTVNSSSIARMFRVDPVTGAPTPFLTDFQVGAPTALTVVRINTPPVATDDGPYVTTGDGPLTVAATEGVLINDSDVDDDPLTASIVSDATHGHVQLQADGSFTYQPDPGFRGLDGFTYSAHDGTAGSSPATVTIRVNSQPVASPDEYGVIAGEVLTVDAPGVLQNDTDPDGDPLSASFAGPVPDGFTGLPDGSFTYRPSAGVSGTVVVPYCASDGVAAGCATATILVTPANAAPVASDDAFTTAQGVPLVVNAPGVLGNDSDPDGDGLSALVEATVSHGSLQLAPDGSLVYTPDPGFVGNDTFTYRALDRSLASAPATVTITVTQAPTGISIGDGQVTEGNRGSTRISFTVTRTGPLDGALRVGYRTVDGTATSSGRDYREKSGTLRFRAGEATVAIEVTVIGDTNPEADEVFSVLLENASGATILDGTGVGTIVNDD